MKFTYDAAYVSYGDGNHFHLISDLQPFDINECDALLSLLTGSLSALYDRGVLQTESYLHLLRCYLANPRTEIQILWGYANGVWQKAGSMSLSEPRPMGRAGYMLLDSLDDRPIAICFQPFLPPDGAELQGEITNNPVSLRLFCIYRL